MMQLLESLLLLLEAENLKTEVVKIAAQAAKLPVNQRQGPTPADIVLVMDGPKKGDEAADDYQVNRVLKALKRELTSYETAEIYDSRIDVEKPTGLSIYAKTGAGKRLVMRVFFSKKPTHRGGEENDLKQVYKSLKIISTNEKPGEKNEMLFVKLLESAIGEAGGKLSVCKLAGENDRELTLYNIVKARWVGGKHDKADAELIDEDGEITKLSLKQRDFFEITAGQEYLKQHKAKLEDELLTAMEHDHIELNDEGKLSKRKSFEVAVKVSAEEAKASYFGVGDNAVSAVLIETFVPSDFKQTKDKLTISCDYVLLSEKDLHGRLWPYASMNSDFTKSEHGAKPIVGQVYLSIIPRFKLRPANRKNGLPPRTHVIEH